MSTFDITTSVYIKNITILSMQCCISKQEVMSNEVWKTYRLISIYTMSKQGLMTVCISRNSKHQSTIRLPYPLKQPFDFFSWRLHTLVWMPACSALSRPWTPGLLEITRMISAALELTGLRVWSIRAWRLVPVMDTLAWGDEVVNYFYILFDYPQHAPFT